MNLYKEMSNNEIELLKNASVSLEDKECLQEDYKKMEHQIIEYIMSASSKNGDMDKRRKQYESMLRKI
mgnify:CR=1 FL=1